MPEASAQISHGGSRGSNPLTSTPNTAGQRVASVEQAALTGMLGPRTPLRVFDVGLGAAAELVDHQSNPSLGWVNDLHS
jgi:hypothetical protein